MELYNLLESYALERNLSPDPNSSIPKLGQSLSLFHSCLLEAGMRNEQVLGCNKIIDPPQALTPSHLSRFVIGYLSKKKDLPELEDNSILFDLYSFLKWLQKKNISHGLERLEFKQAVKDISAHRKRCLKLSNLIESLIEGTLEEPPKIYETWHDLFTVMRILSDSAKIQGQRRKEPAKILLPENLLQLIRNGDHMELTLANTIESWVIIEANEIFPAYPSNKNSK